MKFSIKDLYSKCELTHRKLRIWSHLLKKSLMESFIFSSVLEKYEISREPLKRMELKTNPKLVTQNKNFDIYTEILYKISYWTFRRKSYFTRFS